MRNEPMTKPTKEEWETEVMRWLASVEHMAATCPDDSITGGFLTLLDERDRLKAANVDLTSELLSHQNVVNRQDLADENAKLTAEVERLKAIIRERSGEIERRDDERDRLRTEVECMRCRIDILEGRVE